MGQEFEAAAQAWRLLMGLFHVQERCPRSLHGCDGLVKRSCDGLIKWTRVRRIGDNLYGPMLATTFGSSTTEVKRAPETHRPFWLSRSTRT